MPGPLQSWTSGLVLSPILVRNHLGWHPGTTRESALWRKRAGWTQGWVWADPCCTEDHLAARHAHLPGDHKAGHSLDQGPPAQNQTLPHQPTRRALPAGELCCMWPGHRASPLKLSQLWWAYSESRHSVHTYTGQAWQTGSAEFQQRPCHQVCYGVPLPGPGAIQPLQNHLVETSAAGADASSWEEGSLVTDTHGHRGYTT